MRRFYFRPLPLAVILYALVVIWVHSPVAWALLAVGALLWVGGLASLTLQIKREQSLSDRSDGGQS